MTFLLHWVLKFEEDSVIIWTLPCESLNRASAGAGGIHCVRHSQCRGEEIDFKLDFA